MSDSELDADQPLKVVNTNQSVHRLICSLARLKAIVNFMCPGSHLDSADKFAPDNRLLIKAGKKG